MDSEKAQIPNEIKTVGDVWRVYKAVGLTAPIAGADNFFREGQILKKLLDDRSVLLDASLGVLKIVQKTYHSDDRGPGDQCSKLEDAIEIVTGKKWWEAIKSKGSNR